MSFTKTFSKGQYAENAVCKWFNTCGIKAQLNTDKATNLLWDIECELNNKSFTCECKFDEMSQRTGNLAIEFFNSKLTKASGIDVTKADLWIHCLQDGGNLTMWVCSVTDLKQFLQTHTPARTIIDGGDKNACLYLYPESTMLKVLLKRIDNLSAEQVKTVI